MTQKFPEVKAMVDCAKRFLADETNIHELHGYAQQLKTAAHLFGGNLAITELAEEWITMSYRYWNEWVMQKIRSPKKILRYGYKGK